MPNIVVFRLRPAIPVIHTAFTTGYLANSGNALTIELLDLASGALISSTLTATIKKHGTNSVATGIVEVPGLSPGTTDVVVQVKKGSTLILKFVAYNLPVLSIGPPVSSLVLADYQAFPAGTTITVPSGMSAFNLTDKIALPAGNQPPKYLPFKTAVDNQAVPALESLSLAYCQFLAPSILLPVQTNPQPPLPLGATLEAMYTGTGSGDRPNYESQLNSFNATATTNALQQMTSFIFALAAAHYCRVETYNATQAKLKFPTRPNFAGTPPPPLLTNMDALLQNLAAGSMEIPAEYFYVLGSNMPTSTTPAIRLQSAYAADEITMAADFATANPGIIDISTLAINHYQAARWLKALNVGTGLGLPVCPLAALSPELALFNLWRNETGSNLSFFWTGLPAIGKAGHLNLLVCGLINGYQADINFGLLPPFGAIDAEGLNAKSEDDWKSLMPGADETTKILFLVKIKMVFAVTPSSATSPNPVPGPVPGLSGIAGGPLAAFLTCYPQFEFGQPIDSLLFEKALDCATKGDVCMKEWLEDKIKVINDLLALTNVPGISSTLHFSLMEALFSVGITGAVDIAGLTEAELAAILTGTVAFDFANEIYILSGAIPQTLVQQEFQTVNPNGQLVNCIPVQHLSVLSPTNYLKELLQLRFDSTCKKPFPTILDVNGYPHNLGELLASRRGDFGALHASSANFHEPVPMLDIVLASLENVAGEALPADQHGIVQNTPPSGYDDHSYSQHEPSALLEAFPPNFLQAPNSPAQMAYEKLKNDFSDCCLPYDRALDINRSYLAALGASRFDLLRRFRVETSDFLFQPGGVSFNPLTLQNEFPKQQWRCPVPQSIALEYLCFSQEEVDMIFSKNFEWQWEIQKLNLCDFLKITCLDYCDLYELWKSKFVKFDNNQDRHIFPENAPCCCEEFLMVVFDDVTKTERPLTVEELSKLYIFARLWHKLKCQVGAKYTFAELRDICKVLGMFDTNTGVFNVDALYELIAFQMLRDEYGLGLDATTPHGLLNIWDVNALADFKKLAIENLLGKIQGQAIKKYGCECRPPGFLKLLQENLNTLSELAGFHPNEPSMAAFVWDKNPRYTLCFAQVLSKIYASQFGIGELQWLFSASEHLAGDDPFPMQTKNEALEQPFDLPDNEAEFSLWELRKKLLAAEITDSEADDWSWTKITAVLNSEFGYQTLPSNDPLESLGAHFFPNMLETEGWTVAPASRQYRTGLSGTSAAMWNTPAGGPFRYDNGASQLFTEIPLMDGAVIEKLSQLRQLQNSEPTAVQDLYFMPRAELANFSYLFSNFTEAQDKLIQEPDEQVRWKFFKFQVALFYKRCQITAEHLAQHLVSATGQPNDDGKALALQMLRHVLAAENRGVAPDPDWEKDLGTPPNVQWNNGPNAGAFAALLDTAGTGLMGQFYRANGSLAWLETRGGMEAFGLESNRADLPVPTIISNLTLNASHKHAAVKNGLAFKNQTNELLGGAEGYTVEWTGVLMVEQHGTYSFRAGAPTPGNELPDFQKACGAAWQVTLKLGQREWHILSQNMPGENATGECSASITLKRAAYFIKVKYVHPTLSFETKEESCPQTTGFQLKYKGADTANDWATVPAERLYLTTKEAWFKAMDTLTGVGSDMSNAAKSLLQNRFTGSIYDSRATYQRVFKAMLFAHRFSLSAKPITDDDQSEIGYFLSKPIQFSGEAYYSTDGGSTWATHFAQFNPNFLPVGDNYYTPANDDRANPDVSRRRAMFDWWMRMSEYVRLRSEVAASGVEQPPFVMMHEAAEGIGLPQGSPAYLLQMLGIDLALTDSDIDPNIAPSIVSQFFEGKEIFDADLLDERFAVRIWEANKFIKHLQCRITAKDIRTARPDLWASSKPGEIVSPEMESGNANLTKFVREGWLENGSPKRYLELKNLNDGIRERSRKALLDYLMHTGGFASALALSEFLLQDVEVGLCQKASRLEEAISAVQLFVNRAKLDLESGFPTSTEFNLVWERQFSTYYAWEKCKRREVYRENCIEHEKMEEAQKSDSFRFFEDRLRTQILTAPVSGGTVVLSSPPPPSQRSLTLLQKSEPAILSKLTPTRENFDLMGMPERAGNASWLSNTSAGKTPFWLEAAACLKTPFLRLAAAGLPPGGITFDCEHGGCCDCCCGEPLQQVDEYYFWLIDGEYYEKITQDVNWNWDNPNLLPQLLYWDNAGKVVYLAWTRVRRKEFGQMRWSSEGIRVKPGMIPDLKFKGRLGDSLRFEVVNGEKPAGTTIPPDAGFRYDLATDSALILPSLDQSAGSSANFGGLSSVPYFAYFEPGAPLVPISMFAPALAAACNLRAHCNFEAALRWLELEIKPLNEDNAWLKKSGGAQIGCPKNTPANDTIAARRTLLFQYLEILTQWGKALLRQNKPESFQQARLIFDTARKILGECPKEQALTVSTEFNPTISHFEPQSAPLNPRLFCLYDAVADGLALIHDCLNFQRLKNGKPNKDMPYWGNSPFENCCTDTGCGCNGSDCGCGDDLWCLPASPYRFQFMLNKSLELAGMVSGFGAALLSASEKYDAERLAALRETQGLQLLNLSFDIKKLGYRSADWEVQALQISLASAIYRLKHYVDLIAVGLIQPEQDYISHTENSRDYQVAAKIVFAAAQVLKLIPDLFVGQNNFTWQALGTKAAGILETAAHIIEIFSTIESIEASLSANEGSNFRREQEWFFQVGVITLEIEQIKRQLQGAARRRDSALIEVNNHSLQMQQSAETLDFLRDKFANQQLYLWQQKELAALHYQMYECAMQTAKQAQAAFQRERGYKRNFLDCSIWDNLHQGLLAGEKLQFNLRLMEKAYLDENVREYELNKPISMFHHFPDALLQLKTTGYCELELPEVLFDLDYPGHYMRRIKSVSLTIPCVVGPYMGVHCRLTLLSSSTRVNPMLKCAAGCGCSGCQKGHEHYEALPDDCRLVNEYVATEAIATSNAQNDSCLFQLDFRDERYLPFEFRGAASRWRIELPVENNYFDLHTVSDVVMQVNYTAREAGQSLRTLAAKNAQNYLPGGGRKLFDVKNEMADAWFSLTQPAPTGGSLPMQFGRGMFPFLPYQHQMKINCVEIFVERDTCDGCDQLVLDIHHNCECLDCAPQVTLVKDQAWGGMYHGILPTDWELTKANQNFGKLIFPTGFEEISRVYLLCCYEVVRKECVKETSCECC